jgi:NAD(P)-dependent dehydrogenase (short-subunit alcohol dehydrogenase family)
MRDLNGQRVLITGASRGVGLAATEAFAREGARLALLARPSPALDDAVARARALGSDAVATPADLGDREQTVSAVAAAREALGGFDVVVSNAAVVVFGPFEEVAAEQFDRVVDVTFRGAVDVIRLTLPDLQASQGTVVATGSLMSRIPLPLLSSYASAKYGLRGFLSTLRAEQRAQGTGVEVAMVHPGAVATPLWHQITSATGRLPRVPPEGYDPHVIADALVRAAQDPKAETMVGGEAKAIELLARLGPIGDLLMTAIYRWYDSGREPSEDGSLWEAPPGLDRSSRLFPRPSVVGALQGVAAGGLARLRG